MHTEIDYTRKDATRHIVQGKSNPASLRQKLLRNLEGVRKNKPILQSEVSSLRSRVSRTTRATRTQAQNEDAGLAKIDETVCLASCEVCQKDITDEEDLALNDEINQGLQDEDNVKNAYNAFRKKRGLQAVDFAAGQQQKAGAAKSSPHQVTLCIDCLLECFQAKQLPEGSIELDEVSAYRGSILQGIGLTKHGHYQRKLGDEMGLTRKRAFEKGQHGLSKGFEELAMPSNKETLLIEFNEKRALKQAEEHKLKIAQLSAANRSYCGGPLTDEPAGSRVPKPFKKT